MNALEEDPVLTFEGLEEAACVNQDGPAELHVAMRCCGRSGIYCERCVDRKRRTYRECGSCFALCEYCGHFFGLVHAYDDLVKVTPI